jgi:predicted membrane channel-forming protein YqfA (hemolysin III family)
MLIRLATFILFSGVVLLVLFGISIAAGAADFNLLGIGGLIFLVGFFFWWILPKTPPEPNNRFRSLKQINEKLPKKK